MGTHHPGFFCVFFFSFLSVESPIKKNQFGQAIFPLSHRLAAFSQGFVYSALDPAELRQ
jgi:hypothetical protein